MIAVRLSMAVALVGMLLQGACTSAPDPGARRAALFADLDGAILDLLNHEPSRLASLGARGGSVSQSLISGSFTIRNGGPVLDAGSRTLYEIDDGTIRVIGTVGESGRLASIESVEFAKGAQLTFAQGESFVYDGTEWREAAS